MDCDTRRSRPYRRLFSSLEPVRTCRDRAALGRWTGREDGIGDGPDRNMTTQERFPRAPTTS